MEVYIMDTETFKITRIAENAFFNTHNAVRALWNPDGKKIYFSQSPGTLAVIDMSALQIMRYMENISRQLSPDGTKFVSASNDREWKEGRGVYTMSEDGSEIDRIVSTKELYELTPNNGEFKLDEMIIGNTKWTPDGKHILVAMWVREVLDRRVRRSLYVVSRNDSEKRWLTHFGHHHSWIPNGKNVLYCDYKNPIERKEPRLYLIKFNGLDKHVVIEEPLGGHPLMDPSGEMIVTWDKHQIILVNIREHAVKKLASFKPKFDMSHRGTHPHCVWSREGTQILYNSAQTGNSQIYIIPLE